MTTPMASRSVITVGNFDGVHRGHQALLQRARELARRTDSRVVAVTFTRNPLTVLCPERCPPTLMDCDQREAALRQAGADEVAWLEPTQELLSLSPEQFVDKMVADHRPTGWVEGPDFRFGKRRAGDVQLLQQLGQRAGFELELVHPVPATLTDQTQPAVSSTLVRWLVASGRVADAQICLGRPYTLRGPVVQGEQRGRTIGFPTANIGTADHILPADGVYGGTVTIDDHEYAAAISVGIKPTFGEKRRTFEVYIVDLKQDLYGRTLDVQVLRWLRDQSAYPSVEPLIEQMNRDVARVRQWHAAGLLSAAAFAA